MLDGWRAVSILCVLAGHLLPLGPKAWDLNGAFAATGMVIFFNLSGFLITRMLLTDARVAPFLIRRIFRIVPLAWVAIAILAATTSAPLSDVVANIAFIANLPPTHLLSGGDHLWSLCVEVQFYVGIAALVAIAGRRAIFALPLLGLAVTALRIVQDVPVSIYTWQRIDEILAGATVAIAYQSGRLPTIIPRRMALWGLALTPLIVASAHPEGGVLAFLRPWIAAFVLATTLVALPALADRLFRSRAAVYVASISYALYVVHGMLMATWLFTGDTVIRYLKRPILIALAFALAHLSTTYFESRMIAVGRRLSRRVQPHAQAPTS